MAEPRVTLCLIARDEEALLPACLASARDAVDEVVLVDTGSLDRTVELARAAGARVLHRAWDDDFAAPRNLAAAHATGDFVLQLDADERLAPGGAADLRRCVSAARFDVGLVRCHHADAMDATADQVVSGVRRRGEPDLLPRVLRRTADLRWTGCVHESVLEWARARGGRIEPVPVDLVHLGYVPELVGARSKRARNLALLGKRLEQDPDDLGALGYLAQDLLSAGRLDEAERAAARGWELLGARTAGPVLRRVCSVRAAVALRRDRPEEALAAVERAAPLGAHPDLAYHRACALERLAARAGEPARRRALLDEAAAALRQATELLQRGGFEQVLHVNAAAAWARRGTVAVRAGDAAAAADAFRAARGAGAGERIALVEAEVLLEEGRPDEALAAVQRLLPGEAAAWDLAARAAEAMGAAEEAKVFRARAGGS